MSAIQMVDVQLPTTDGRTVILSRYTEPEPDQALLIQRLKINLPGQPPPRIISDGTPISQSPSSVVPTLRHHAGNPTVWGIFRRELRKSG